MTVVRRIPLLRDRSGVAAVELAILSPVLVLILGAFFDLGYMAYARATLESATLKAARSAIATACPGERYAKIRAMIDSQMGGIKSADGTPTSIVVKSYGDSFGDVGNPEPFTDKDPKNGVWNPGETYVDVNGNGKYDTDMGRDNSLGEAGEVVSYNTSFKVASLMPYIAKQIGGNSYYSIGASTSVRNEPVFQTDGCKP